MGATGWTYFVPYEADISAALQRLREDVFARGDYVYGDNLTDQQIKAILEKTRPEMDPWMQEVRKQAETLPEPIRTVYLQKAESFKRSIMSGDLPPKKRKPKSKTIEAVLEFQAESGTHSILDIVGISPEPQFRHISPLPREKLAELFGSATPTHAEIETAHDSGSLEDFVSERWEGIYVVAYHEGLPSEIFFAGCSGD